MLEQIILILDRGAVSFCHYDNAAYRAGFSETMTRDVLASIVDYAGTNGLMLNVLFPDKPLPDGHLHLLEGVRHVKIVPFRLRKTYPESVPVLDWDSSGQADGPPGANIDNVIVRLSGPQLPELRRVLRYLKGSARRINVTLTALQHLSDHNLQEYEHQLSEIVRLVAGWYVEGNMIELNFLSDRLFLRAMKNCDAGIRHITFAPDGKFYICPGFYHSSSPSDVGSLQSGIRIPNQELLELSHAPICSRCDAYHCRRCVYLNKLTTRELNTPSRQQCVASHLERNASRRLVRRLKPSLTNFQELSDVPEIDYLDPLDQLREKRPPGQIELKLR